jgi:hypothetical protein
MKTNLELIEQQDTIWCWDSSCGRTRKSPSTLAALELLYNWHFTWESQRDWNVRKQKRLPPNPIRLTLNLHQWLVKPLVRVLPLLIISTNHQERYVHSRETNTDDGESFHSLNGHGWSSRESESPWCPIPVFGRDLHLSQWLVRTVSVKRNPQGHMYPSQRPILIVERGACPSQLPVFAIRKVSDGEW